jgi:hypothetical protein
MWHQCNARVQHIYAVQLLNKTSHKYSLAAGPAQEMNTRSLIHLCTNEVHYINVVLP